jgi:hypothetical protein
MSPVTQGVDVQVKRVDEVRRLLASLWIAHPMQNVSGKLDLSVGMEIPLCRATPIQRF